MSNGLAPALASPRKSRPLGLLFRSNERLLCHELCGGDWDGRERSDGREPRGGQGGAMGG